MTFNENACPGSEPGQAQIKAIDGAIVAQVPAYVQVEAVLSTTSKPDGFNDISTVTT